MKKDWREATRQGDLEQVRRLLEQGVDIDSKDEHGQTALMHAAHEGRTELVRLLIDRGADMNVTAKYNFTALMLSLIAHHPEIARTLIEAGAEADGHCRMGLQEKSVLRLAEDGRYSEIASLLRQRGAA